MTTGALVSYDAIKGFGFIRPNSGSTDVIIHVNDFGLARREVDVGMRFAFDTEACDGAVRASNVRLMDHVLSRQTAETREITDPRSLGQRIHSGDYRVELTELLLTEAA